MQSPFPLRRFLYVICAGTLIGALYAYFQHAPPAVGAAIGGSMAIAIFSLERFVLRRNASALFGRLPFLPYLALRSSLYVGVLLSVNELAIRFGTPEGRFVAIRQVDMLFSVTLCIAGNLLFSVNDLLGPGVLFAFAAGRDHHPRREERMLLFIDMRSSTAIAERLGRNAVPRLPQLLLLRCLRRDRGRGRRYLQICRRRGHRDLGAGAGPERSRLRPRLFRRARTPRR